MLKDVPNKQTIEFKNNQNNWNFKIDGQWVAPLAGGGDPTKNDIVQNFVKEGETARSQFKYVESKISLWKLYVC